MYSIIQTKLLSITTLQFNTSNDNKHKAIYEKKEGSPPSFCFEYAESKSE